MKNHSNHPALALALGLTLAGSGFPGAVIADEDPLFLFPSQIVKRYTVGDVDARNPINSTEGPKAIAAGDLNNDGREDIIAGNLDGSISVLLGDPDGLQPQILIPAQGLLAEGNIRSLAVADFNGDGNLDVAAADIAGEGIVLLLGNGDGTLEPFERTDLGPARALAAADFNGDGRMDLLLAASPPDCDWEAGSSFLAVLLGNGDGSFQEPHYLLSPGVNACFYQVAAADINQDGHPDALVVENSFLPEGELREKRVLIFINNGDGTFGNAPQVILDTAGEGPRAFAVAYLDETMVDGNPPPGATLDLVVANRDSSSLDVFLNQGGLNFSAPITLRAGDSPRDVAAADLDGNGLADLIVVNRRNNTISILQGLGGGQFTDPVAELPTGVSPRQIVLADINGDGVLDAAVNNRYSEDISVHIGKKGLVGFMLMDGFYPTGTTPMSVVAEDFNGDGWPDLVTANMRSHDVRVRLNLGDGTFGPEIIYPVNRDPVFVAAGDLNGDGHLDLVVSCMGAGPDATTGSGSLVSLMGLGNGSFHFPAAVPIAGGAGRPYWLRLGDLTGDGKLDVVISGVSGELVAMRGRGDGSFDPNPLFSFPGNGRPLGLALGDFDGNGHLDIATSMGEVLLNDGQFAGGNRGGFPRRKQFPAGFQAWAVEAADLDEDGKLDLMVALTFVNPDPIGVYFGKGDGSFEEPDIYDGPDVGVVAMVARDMDGDGIQDIVIGNRCAATVMILKGEGERRFRFSEVVNTSSLQHIAVADFNGDGKPDLAGVGFGLWVLLSGAASELIDPRVAAVGSAPERDGVFINELMALNQEFYFLNNTTPDWIELYNHSSEPESLTGWSLQNINADDKINTWQFPEGTSIAPWGRLVVFCKKRATGPELFASFELSSEGETVVLLGPGGVEVDRVRFPALPANVSYSRFSDGARFFALNPSPTMGTRNLRPANLRIGSSWSMPETHAPVWMGSR